MNKKSGGSRPWPLALGNGRTDHAVKLQWYKMESSQGSGKKSKKN